jgi:hypothetical protein
MTCACSAWEFAAENHLLKLQRLQNKVLRTISNLARLTLVELLLVNDVYIREQGGFMTFPLLFFSEQEKCAKNVPVALSSASTHHTFTSGLGIRISGELLLAR